MEQKAEIRSMQQGASPGFPCLEKLEEYVVSYSYALQKVYSVCIMAPLMQNNMSFKVLRKRVENMDVNDAHMQSYSAIGVEMTKPTVKDLSNGVGVSARLNLGRQM